MSVERVYVNVITDTDTMIRVADMLKELASGGIVEVGAFEDGGTVDLDCSLLYDLEHALRDRATREKDKSIPLARKGRSARR